MKTKAGLFLSNSDFARGGHIKYAFMRRPSGNWLYGTEEPELIGRPALHSYRLEFVHPLRGEKLCIKAELPQDMQKLLSRH